MVLPIQDSYTLTSLSTQKVAWKSSGWEMVLTTQLSTGTTALVPNMLKLLGITPN